MKKILTSLAVIAVASLAGWGTTSAFQAMTTPPPDKLGLESPRIRVVSRSVIGGREYLLLRVRDAEFLVTDGKSLSPTFVHCDEPKPAPRLRRAPDPEDEDLEGSLRSRFRSGPVPDPAPMPEPEKGP